MKRIGMLMSVKMESFRAHVLCSKAVYWFRVISVHPSMFLNFSLNSNPGFKWFYFYLVAARSSAGVLHTVQQQHDLGTVE